MYQDLRLYILDTGEIQAGDYALFRPDVPPQTKGTLSVRSYVVRHPRGTLVWDTGLSDSIAELPDGLPIMDAFVFRVARTMRSQLEEIGVDPLAVDYLALSHLHNDHVGNIDLFPDATVLVHEEDHRAAFGEDPGKFLYEPDTYASLADRRLQLVQGEHDVFGEGTVVTKFWPGHTPGHMGLVVRLPETGPVVLAADLAHSTHGFEQGIVSSLNADEGQSLRSIADAREFARETGASLWFNHDAEQQRGLETSPAFYG